MTGRKNLIEGLEGIHRKCRMFLTKENNEDYIRRSRLHVMPAGKRDPLDIHLESITPHTIGATYHGPS